MLDSMSRENFYNSGTYFIEAMGVYLGWTCHRRAPNDCLPIINETKDAILLLTGEVFAESGIVGYLESRGHRIPGPGLSYLIHFYEEQGEQFFSSLDGWFSGVLVDHRKGRCTIFNDRYGMERLFIHDGKEDLYFASEAKALLNILPETRRFDPKGLGEFLTCGCTLGTRSLYECIQVMPAASSWMIEKDSAVKKRVYFNRTEWQSQKKLDERQFIRAFIDTFPAVVKKYGKAEISVGISLTGGFDSRILIACLDAYPEAFPCYTFGSMIRETFDVSIAREVAKKCRQSHSVLVLGEEFLRNLPHYIEKAVYRSDGYIGLSGAAELYLNALARNIAPVRLTGNYGSELLRNISAFKSIIPKVDFVTHDLYSYMREAQKTFKMLETADPISFALFHQAPHQGYGRLSIEKSQVIMRTPFMDNGLVKLIYQRPVPHVGEIELYTSILNHYRPDLMEIPTDRGELGKGSVLTKKLRSTYYKALFKGEYWANHGMPQCVSTFVGCVSGLFSEQLFFGRHKFQHYSLWLRKELSEYVKDVLLSNACGSNQLERNNMERMINSHLKGQKNYTDEIDMALTIALIGRVLFSRPIHSHQNINI